MWCRLTLEPRCFTWSVDDVRANRQVLFTACLLWVLGSWILKTERLKHTVSSETQWRYSTEHDASSEGLPCGPSNASRNFPPGSLTRNIKDKSRKQPKTLSPQKGIDAFMVTQKNCLSPRYTRIINYRPVATPALLNEATHIHPWILRRLRNQVSQKSTQGRYAPIHWQ